MKNIAALLVLCLALASCARGTSFEEKLNTWIGKPEERLIAANGIPDRVYTSGDSRFLEYYQRDVLHRSGTPPAYQITQQNRNKTLVQPFGGSSDSYQEYWCRLVITVKNGIITAWQYKGNNCE